MKSISNTKMLLVRYLPFINSATLIIFFALTVIQQNTKNVDVAYVDSTILFKEFQMTKESKAAGEKLYLIQSQAIDSLSQVLKYSEDSNLNSDLMQSILRRKEDLEHFEEQFVSEEFAKIWSRIKNYIEEFSKKEGAYKIIISSQEDNTILYGVPDSNITNELLTYINQRYNGEK